MMIIIYTFSIIIGLYFATQAILKLKEISKISKIVKSTKTHALSDISNFLNKYIELNSEINGEFLTSPISKSKCVKYKVEVFYSGDPTKVVKISGMDLLTSSVVEEKMIDDTYLVEGNTVITFDLDEQEKVYLQPFEWHLMNIKQKKVVEDYLNLPKNKHFIKELGFRSNNVFGLRESIIPHGKKVYVLGKVSKVLSRSSDEYIQTKNNYNYIPYTLKGCLDSVSEDHFIDFLRKKKLFLLYTSLSFLIIPLVIVLGKYW